jgi:hypothetical protein
VRALAVLRRAVQGKGDPLGQRLDQAPLVACGAAPGVAPAEREHADRPAASDQRHERRAMAEDAVGLGAEVLEERRLLGLERAGDARVRGDGHQALTPVGDARVGARAAQGASVVDDVERAGVGHARHQQLGQLLQCLVAAHRALEQRAGVGQQAHTRVRGLAGPARGLLDLEHAVKLALLRDAVRDVAGDDHQPIGHLGAQPAARRLDRNAGAVRAHDVGAEGLLARLAPGARADKAAAHGAVDLLGQQREQRGQRGELLGRAPGEDLGRRVGIDDALALQQHERLTELALRTHQRLVEVALGAHRLGGLGAIGDVDDGRADAQALSPAQRHRVVVGEVAARAAGLARRLALQLHADQRLAALGHPRECGLDLLPHLREHLARGAPEVVDRGHPVDLGHRVVDPHVAEVRVQEGHPDRRGGDQCVEQRGGLARRALLGARLAVEPGVVDRQRGARGDLGGEGDVVLGVGRALARAHEGDRAEHAPARAQRHDEDRARVQGVDHLQVLRVDRPLLEPPPVDLRDELGLARVHDVRRPARPVALGRVALAHLARQRGAGRVDVGHGDVAQPVLCVDEIDHAPVGDRAHAEVGDRLEGRVHVQRRVERSADVGEQARLLQRAVLGVHEPGDADDRPAAVLVDDEAPARVVPVHGAVGPDHPRLVLAGLAAGRGRRDRVPEAGAIVGVHALDEGIEGRRRLVGRDAGERGQRVRPAQLAAGHVHAERARASGVEHQGELVAAEALLSKSDRLQGSASMLTLTR